jgi:hypothetical protein
VSALQRDTASLELKEPIFVSTVHGMHVRLLTQWFGQWATFTLTLAHAQLSLTRNVALVHTVAYGRRKLSATLRPSYDRIGRIIIKRLKGS